MLFSENDQSLIPLYHKVLPKLNGKFREAQKFRPLRIIIQIFTIQLAFWLTALSLQGLLITIPSITTTIENQKFIIYPSLSLLFNLQNYSIKSVETCLNCLCLLISGFISAYYLKFIIKRSRLCLDFSLTCHLVHLLTASIYNRQFPLNLTWWSLTILSTWLMTERSRSLCMFQELLPIGVKRTELEDEGNGNLKRNCGKILDLIRSFFKSKKTSNSTINLYSSKSPLNPK